jgi:alkylation response protein AidB-like acyl-CoA dehydrogenase
MDFALTQDQQMLEESARKFFEEQHPVTMARRPPGWREPKTRTLWSDLAQMGFLDLLVPQESDGLGLGFVEAWIVQEAAGRVLFSLPLAESMLLWPALDACTGAGPLQHLARQIRGGNACVPLELRRGNPEGAAFDSVQDVDDLHVITLDGVDTDAIHMQWNLAGSTTLQGLDPSRSRTQTRGAPAESTALPGLNFDALDLQLRLLRAASSVGTAARALEITCNYASERVQFGKPIGIHQAIKHRLANNWMALDHARLAGLYAASAIDSNSPDATFAHAAAIACAVEATQATVADAIQFHGALGFSWEHDAHLYFKRVMHLNALQGPVDQLFDQVWKQRRLNDVPIAGSQQEADARCASGV